MKLGVIQAAILGIFAASPAFALTAEKTVDVKASPDKVWQTIGTFCGIADWHPAVAKCVITKSGKMPVRTLSLKGGGTLVEKQTARSNSAHRYSYTILKGPLPVSDYHSTLSVIPKDTGSTISWTGHFEAKGAADADAQKAIQGIYDSGLDALAAKTDG